MNIKKDGAAASATKSTKAMKTLSSPVTSKVGVTKARKRIINLNYKSLSPKHSAFHAAYREDNKPFRYIGGSVGSGKTRAACAEIIRLLLTDARWFGKTFLVCGITSQHVRQLLMKEIIKVLTITNKKGKHVGLRNGVDYKITYFPTPMVEFNICTATDGTKGRITTYSLEAGQSVRGFNVSGIFGDDLSATDKDTWDALCDRAGREEDGIISIIGTCNPTNQESWLYKSLWGPAAEGTLDTSQYFVETLTLYDNPSLKQRWPILEAMYKPGTVEHRRKILGEWCSQAGLCLPSFKNSNIMKREHMNEFIREGISYTGHDFGGRDPTTCVWISKYKNKNGENHYYVYREYFNQVSGTPISTHSAHILSFTEHIARRWSDNPTESVNTYRENGLNLTPSQKSPGSVAAGLALINQLFESNLLTISDSCPHLIKEIRSLEWKQNTIRDEPKPGGDHVLDGCRYVLLELAGKNTKITSFFGTEQTLKDELPSIAELENSPIINTEVTTPDYLRELQELKDQGLMFIGFGRNNKPLYASVSKETSSN